ncbi:hypothetical protein GCM10007304_44960 [Rhodococcoides trifolii]|uniref:SnoaL-like domain-containing protein n=1 Tax=Rhodococcoides trifolii TaxID=908250 RepID=A0A917G715_9NOCA|nr:hypothetical protein [Rhodococcus trifolii]GGG26135.1 hypothetical protein GCM10007304_44960 [Rhodococcus trifolii]
MTGKTTSTEVLETWFAYMDSADPDRVLGMISDDFEISILFSKGQGDSAEFVGDREGLVRYLAQREKSTLVHHIEAGACVNGTELVLGKTTRGGEFEASFNASAQLDAEGKVRRMLMARSPEISFS